jgi:hypothetical protein
MVSDVVLIHSTGQGAAGWERVVHALAERGGTAHVVELPSDPELLADGYTGLIRRQVGVVAAPIVLAHSGAGPLLPAAARALQACHQVWLAAWVPDPEASFVEEIDRHARDAFHPDWIGKDPTEDDAVAAALDQHEAALGALLLALQQAVGPGQPPTRLGELTLVDQVERQPERAPRGQPRLARLGMEPLGTLQRPQAVLDPAEEEGRGRQQLQVLPGQGRRPVGQRQRGVGLRPRQPPSGLAAPRQLPVATHRAPTSARRQSCSAGPAAASDPDAGADGRPGSTRARPAGSSCRVTRALLRATTG